MSFRLLIDTRRFPPRAQFDAWHEFHNNDLTRFRAKRELDRTVPFRSWSEGCAVGGLHFKRTHLDIPGDSLTTLNDKSAEHHGPPIFCLQGPIRGEVVYDCTVGRFNQAGSVLSGHLMLYDPAHTHGSFRIRHGVENILLGIPQSRTPFWLRQVVQKRGIVPLSSDNDLVRLTLYPHFRDCDVILKSLTDNPASGMAYAQGLLSFIEAALSPLSGLEAKSGKKTDTEAQREATYQALLALIKVEISNKSLSAKKAAECLNVSSRYVFKLFALHGTTFGDEVKRQRLLKVSEELADPRFRRDKIKDIADRYGFYDASPFNKLFKAEFKMTPSDYRQQFTNQDGKAEG